MGNTCTSQHSFLAWCLLLLWLQAGDAAAADSAGDTHAADAGLAAGSQATAGDAAAADKQPEQQQQPEQAAAAAASTTSSSSSSSAASSSSSSKGEARGSGVFFTTGGKDGKPEVKTEMIIEPVPEVPPLPRGP